MNMRKLDGLVMALAAWGVSAAVITACAPGGRVLTDDDGTTGTSTSATGTTTTGEQDETAEDAVVKHDHPDHVPPDPAACESNGSCNRIDLVIIVDNSGTMGEEQLDLARTLPQLVDDLTNLTDAAGDPLEPDVNIMVTTTDFGHPLCTPFQKPDYTPRQGAPVYTGCNARIERFTGLDPMDPVVIEEACTEGCPVDVAPSEPFINFSPMGTNVPGGDVHAALACIGPQGIDGCGFEAPLETMLRAIDEEACWNRPDQGACDADPEWAEVERGFLRDDATLAIAIVTDELDCSVQGPDGYSYFIDADNAIYWNVSPALGVPQASSAICFNAGVSCTDDDGDGLYESCTASDDEVLQPVERYIEYFDYLTEERGKDVVMLGILGVPEVVAHNPSAPFQPIAGGAVDLVYRNWVDLPYPAGDILPDEWDAGRRAADKVFELGAIGPGCTGIDDLGAFTGQAIPPVRMREVCESLDHFDEETGETRVGCCIESICDMDISPATRCLTGVISGTLLLPG
jgi:hypothetical protein